MPLVKLDDSHFKLVDQLEALVAPGSEPSLKEAASLTVKGPVKFAKGARLRGVWVAGWLLLHAGCAMWGIACFPVAAFRTQLPPLGFLCLVCLFSCD